MNVDRPNGMVRGVCVVGRRDPAYPGVLTERLGTEAPAQLTLIGNPALLGEPKTALFCSARCPGDAILAALDQAAQWRDTGRCVISGFQAPLEKECLRVLLRGRQPVVVCVAHGLGATSRVPPAWKRSLAEGRLLLVCGCSTAERRVTRALAYSRNLLVAALANEVYIAYATPGGALDALGQRLRRWPGFAMPVPPQGGRCATQ